METYCVNCKKNTANENSSVRKTKQNRLMLLSMRLTRESESSLKIKDSIQ